MNVHVDAPDLQKLSAELGVARKDIESAMRRAVVRTTKWAQSSGAAAIARVTHIKQSIIKGRVAITVHAKEGKGRVFYGLNPVSLSRLNPRQTSTGVKAGPANIAGAFLTQKFGKMVFKRVGKDRLPIEKQEFAFNEQAEAALREYVVDLIEQKLMHEFEHELKWQTRPK